MLICAGIARPKAKMPARIFFETVTIRAIAKEAKLAKTKVRATDKTVTARILNYERDGFSKPYYVFYLLNALLFIFLGLLYLRKLLNLFFDDNTTGLSILLIYLGSNTLITFGIQYDLTHLYLFAPASTASFVSWIFTCIEARPDGKAVETAATPTC